MGIQFLRCAHGNERTRTHDAVCDIFVAIAWNVGFHIGQKQLYALHSTTFNSFHWQVDIMFAKDGIHTIVNIVIANPTYVDLFIRSCTTQKFVASNAILAQKKNYRNWHPINQFLPLAIEVFGCLHKHANAFLHNYANDIWSLKGPKGLPLSILVVFFLFKGFNYVVKDAIVLHLKSGNGGRPNYFLTSTP